MYDWFSGFQYDREFLAFIKLNTEKQYIAVCCDPRCEKPITRYCE